MRHASRLCRILWGGLLAALPLGGAAAAEELPVGPPRNDPPAETVPGPEVALPSDAYDIVVLKAHNEQLFGKVIIEDPQFILFDVQAGGTIGRMRIDRDKILNLTYDLHHQADGLDAKDVNGWFAIAMKAYKSGYWSLALDWLSKVGAMLPADPQGDLRNVFKYAGKAADYQDKYDEALKQYVEHLKLNPDDKEIEARVKELRDYLGVIDPKDAGKKKKWPNGFEDVSVYNWRGEKWGGNNTGNTSDQVVPHGLDGDDHILAISFQPGQFDKLVVGDRPSKPYNFTGATKLRLTAHFQTTNKDPKNPKAPGRPIKISLAFKSPGSNWMETDVQDVPSTEDGWSNMTFKLDGDATFKTQETGWAFQSKLIQPDQIQNVYILVHNKNLGGNLYINDMGVE